MQQKKYTPEKCTIKTYKSENGKTEFLKQNPAFHNLNPQTREDKTTAKLVNVHKRKLTSCVKARRRRRKNRQHQKCTDTNAGWTHTGGNMGSTVAAEPAV